MKIKKTLLGILLCMLAVGALMCTERQNREKNQDENSTAVESPYQDTTLVKKTEEKSLWWGRWWEW